MEVLFDYKGCKTPLKPSSTNELIELLLTELRKYDDRASLEVSLQDGSPRKTKADLSSEVYLLQKWSEKWKAYVNVDTTVTELALTEGDMFTVVPKPFQVS